MPEIPDIDIEGAGDARQQQHQIDTDPDRNDPKADRRTESNGCGRGPTHIDHVTYDAGILDDRLGDIAEAGPHQADDEIDADEGDADGDAGAESAAGPCSQDK